MLRGLIVLLGLVFLCLFVFIWWVVLYFLPFEKQDAMSRFLEGMFETATAVAQDPRRPGQPVSPGAAVTGKGRVSGCAGQGPGLQPL